MIAPPEWIQNHSNEEIKRALKPMRQPLEIAMHDTSNYFNLGSVIRLSHNFLCRKVYAVDMNGKYYKKATMGAKKYETIEACTLDEFLEKTKKRNLIAFERRPDLKNVKQLYDYKWPSNPIIFFGGEKFGVPDRVLEAATDVVSIPVYGVLNDFNVAMAVGMATYDWMIKNRKG